MSLDPSRDDAVQYALILSSGVPPRDAIRYFLPDGDDLTPGVIETYLSRWSKSKPVQDAVLAIQGKPWEGMTLDEKIRFTIDKTYTEMAYYLYSHNYAELSGSDKQKADTCRSTLEAKLAGMAGKLGALDQFWQDVTSGKVKLNPTPSTSLSH